MSTSETPMAKYLAKIEKRGPLPAAARKALLAVPTISRSLRPYQDLVREGDRPERCCFVETGLVSRYKALRNGARQILSFHIPGDMVDLQSALVVVADHGIRAHVATTVVTIAHSDVLALAAEYPSLAHAFWFDTLIDAAVFREWTVNVGRRNSRERTAHLLLELATRFEGAGMMVDNSFHLPVSQNDISDALGITPVHLNRTLQWMRGQRYIRTHSRDVMIENWPEMIALGGFDPAYLHPEGPRQISG
ncbi:MAG TPA: Crp/Fnr family transcriptional regulator [Allosphingosinicella sp.]|jgi:CRP-like cAMP-binding protein